MKKLKSVPDSQARLIARQDVLSLIESQSPNADESGAEYLRQQFPPRSSNPVYTALVIAAGGIDYQRKHETVVDPSKAAPVDLEVAEQREEYERAVTELELAARGAYLATDLTA